MIKILLTILLTIFIFVGYQTYRTKKLIKIGIKLAEDATAFEQIKPNAKLNILVIGDSTAVGTGASDPHFSIAGLVGKDFPEANIYNKGVNGSKTHELIPRLRSIENKYDIIMLHIGGNDIVRRTDIKDLGDSIDQVLSLAKQKADKVTLTTTGNIGTVPLLPLGTRWFFGNQTRKVRLLFMEAAKKHQVSYVDLFREKPNDPFAKDPQKYYASDLFHPSDEGYKDWYFFINHALKKIDFE